MPLSLVITHFQYSPCQSVLSSVYLPYAQTAFKHTLLLPFPYLYLSAQGAAGNQSSLPSNRSFSRSSHQFSLSGSFGRFPFRRKSPGGFFVQSDQPYADSGSGDSDSSSESLQSGSMNSGNLAMQKGTRRQKSVDISHGRLNRSNSLLQTVFSHIGRRKKQATIPISQNELIDRLKKLIVFSVDTAVFSGNICVVFVSCVLFL